MWMVPPKILCHNHLFGEHLETHMFLGVMKKQTKLFGYLSKNLLEPLSLKSRHDLLEEEMRRRGFQPNSPIAFDESILEYLGNWKYTQINKKKAKEVLLSRCLKCKERDKLVSVDYNTL